MPDGVRILLSQCSSRYSRVVAGHKRGHLRRVQVDARVPWVQWVAHGGRAVRRALVGRHPGVVDRVAGAATATNDTLPAKKPPTISLRQMRRRFGTALATAPCDQLVSRMSGCIFLLLTLWSSGLDAERTRVAGCKDSRPTYWARVPSVSARGHLGAPRPRWGPR